MLILKVSEIYDLACMAGFSIITHPEHMPDNDEMEMEITVEDCPVVGLLDDDDISRRYYSKIAYFSEYPEEGCIGLGTEIINKLVLTGE